MEFLLGLLACFGMTFTFVHAKIMDILGIRPFLNRWEFTKQLQHCSLCSGFWIGLLYAILFIPLKFVIPFAFAASGFSFFFERIAILVDELVMKMTDKDD